MVVRVATHPSKQRPDLAAYLSATDEQLVAQFQTGDGLAFHALVERHAGLLWRIARQYFGATSDIDDLIQDLTLTLWQNKKAWAPGDARFSTWLYRVVANRCIDILRSRKVLNHDGVLPEHLGTSELNGEDRMVRLQLTDQLKLLLDALPLTQKMALVLYYYEEATVDEIAERLAVTQLAARSLLKRGKEKLRGMISAEAGNLNVSLSNF